MFLYVASLSVLAFNIQNATSFVKVKTQSFTQQNQRTLTINSSSSLHGLGESPVPASSVVVTLYIFFLVYLCLIFRMVDIYMPVVECGYVPFFAIN
jgi:hypothetical protein